MQITMGQKMAALKRGSKMLPMTSRLCALLALTIAALLAGACSAASIAPPTVQGTPAPTPEPRLAIGLLLSSLSDPLHLSMNAGAVESARRLNVDLVMRQADNEAGRQLEQIAELLALDIDALILNPVDSAAIGAGVQQANEAGVPVITVERRVRGARVTAHVASDDITGGEMAAAYLVEELREEGQVAELMGTPGTSAAQDRSAGFGRVLGGYEEIDVVARGVAYFDRDRARRVFAEILEGNANLDAVFAHNDAMILGAIEAAEEAGRAQEIVFMGYDAMNEAVNAIEAGRLAATVAQQPEEMGHLSVEIAVEELRGGEVIEELTVDLAVITR